MKLSDAAIAEFQAIWKDEFGETISPEQARECGSRLVELFILLGKKQAQDAPPP